MYLQIGNTVHYYIHLCELAISIGVTSIYTGTFVAPLYHSIYSYIPACAAKLLSISQ